MELKLIDGDYAADASGGLATVSGIEELAQRVLMKLTARRGSFPLMPDYGSRLYTCPRSSPPKGSWRLSSTSWRPWREEDLRLRSLDIKYLKDDCMELELRSTTGKMR